MIKIKDEIINKEYSCEFYNCNQRIKKRLKSYLLSSRALVNFTLTTFSLCGAPSVQ